MKRGLVCVAGTLLVSAVVAAQPSLPPELEPLRAPQLATRPAVKVLAIEAQGDPRTVGGGAFGLLFRLYYQISETPKGPEQAAPRARWPSDLSQPRSDWMGVYALPVPESVSRLPEHRAPPGLNVMLSVWDYGEVAEILHIGPYDREEPTLQRLRDFVEARGYVLTGEHEEEYIRGPTMAGPGDPEQYLTILRYRVARPPTER